MLFNSLAFAGFFAVVWPLYWALPHRGRNVLILAASYSFYACWDVRFLGLLAASTAVDWALGLAIGAESRPGRRRAWLAASMALNLGFLGFFKYFNFFADSMQSALGGLGWSVPMAHLEVALPVGISFYTFQSMSYVIDVYRGEIAPTRNLVRFAAFVSFFPHLVAGPIMRATTLLPQIERPRRWDWDQVQQGACLIFWGLVKKVVVADNLALMVDRLFNRPWSALDGGEVLIAGYAFAFQIYCDFSGYTDIARGVSKMIGFELALNFRRPFLATSPKELWARWHISLSSWLRDYVFIPLGGSRGGQFRACVNLCITMTLCGLWHGASWNCVLWGLYCGVWLSLHRLVDVPLLKLRPTGVAGGVWRVAAIVTTFHLFVLGVLLFRSPSVGYFLGMMQQVVGAWDWPAQVHWGPLLLFALPLLIVEAIQEWGPPRWDFLRLPWPARSVAYASGFYAMALLGEYGGTQFYYFQF